MVLGLEGIAVSVAIGTKMRRRIREPDGALLGCAGKNYVFTNGQILTGFVYKR